MPDRNIFTPPPPRARRDVETRKAALREAAERMRECGHNWAALAIEALIEEPAHD